MEGVTITTEGARRLAAAVVVQAVADAGSGDAEAREWLTTTGADLLDLLDIADRSTTRRAVNRGLPDGAVIRRRAGRLKEAASRRKRPKDDAASAGYMLRHEVAKVDKAAVRFLRSRGLYAGLDLEG